MLLATSTTLIPSSGSIVVSFQSIFRKTGYRLSAENATNQKEARALFVL